jgi:D-3-phosphoglycerate dehydrogenase
MIGRQEIRAMKLGAYLINSSRGTVVDLEALTEALREERPWRAAVDVFPSEPGSSTERFISPLQGLPNVVLTPHIGGSTEAAQERIGSEVARRLTIIVTPGLPWQPSTFPTFSCRDRLGMLGQLHDAMLSTRLIFQLSIKRLAAVLAM